MTATARAFHSPTAASVFAGVVAAGAVDLVFTWLRAAVSPGAGLMLLAASLYGVIALVTAAGLGWAVGVLRAAVPPASRPLAAHEQADRTVAAALLAFACGAAALAGGMGVAHAAFIGGMASRTLAAIATAGLALALAPAAALLALASRGTALRVAGWLPRPGRWGCTGLLLVAFGSAGLIAFVLALSRADWRVLDLGPLVALSIAVPFGLAHGWFWHRSGRAPSWSVGLPRKAGVAALVIAVAGLLVAASRVPEAAPAYQAIQESSLGLRSAVAVARRVTDRDGDGYSRLFGGGDCDDRNGGVFPGAEEVPGNGLDDNCEGGDASARAAEQQAESPTVAAPAEAARPRAGAFAGNLLMISVDALRADRLGVAGYGRPPGRSLTPTLDALAKRGAYFRRVWAQAPNTPRSFPSLLTSRYPSEIAWQQRSLNYSPILPSNETFFEGLARGGWKPIGIFSHFYFTKDRGLSQGFAEWSNDGAGTIAESNKDVAAPRVVARVIERLRRAAASKERFALWTHLFEPHSSYVTHAEFPTKLSGVAGLQEKYDYEIAFADLWIGKLLQALADAGLAESTTVVVHADHGEAWGEHRLYFHGQDLTEEQLRVPLIIAVPGRAPVMVDEPVALVDLGPTLLDLVGLPLSPTFRGRSLLPFVDGGTLPARPLFGELLPATAWPKHESMTVDGSWKLTHKITERRFELHDLASDPGQQRDRSAVADQPTRAALERLKARLLQFEERHH